MEEKRAIKLPDNWDEMYHFEKVCWFGKNFSTEEDDEEGNLKYDTDNMSDEVFKAYKEVIEYRRELKKKGILID